MAAKGDPEIPEAWRYRDYLIRAFNADVPYDQLIREHLAGDLLPKPRRESRSGFNESMLGTAQFRLVEHGFQPIDTLDDQVKAVDNQIDVVSKAFQGLTVSCARCHDHKFDAISQRDYYALYGIFASCRPAQVTIDRAASLAVRDSELAALKGPIRETLADAWSEAAARVSERLLHLGEGDLLATLVDDAAKEFQQIRCTRGRSLRRRVGPFRRSGRVSWRNRAVLRRPLVPLIATTFEPGWDFAAAGDQGLVSLIGLGLAEPCAGVGEYRSDSGGRTRD